MYINCFVWIQVEAGSNRKSPSSGCESDDSAGCQFDQAQARSTLPPGDSADFMTDEGTWEGEPSVASAIDNKPPAAPVVPETSSLDYEALQKSLQKSLSHITIGPPPSISGTRAKAKSVLYKNTG